MVSSGPITTDDPSFDCGFVLLSPKNFSLIGANYKIFYYNTSTVHQ